MLKTKFSQILCLLIFLFFCTVLLSVQKSNAGLETIADAELDTICGQAGVSIAIKNVEIFQYIDNFTYTCPENAFGTCEGYLSLKNIETHNRNGDTALYNYDFGSVTHSGLIHYDVMDCRIASEEDWAFGTAPTQIGKLMTSVIAPVWDQEVGYFIGNIVFGDPNEGGVKDLGWADVGIFDLKSFRFYTAPHGSGIDFEFDFELHIDTLTYGYQENGAGCETLAINDIHIGDTFGFGLGTDNPADPSTWYTATGTSIGEFKIGDIFGDFTNGIHSNPATIDATDSVPSDNGAATKHAGVLLDLPLEGAIRFEQVKFDATDFGPGAIDGIKAHRFFIEIVP